MLETPVQPWTLYLFAALHAVTALVWSSLARSYCFCHSTVRPRGALRLFAWMAWMFAAHYGAKAVLDFGPPTDGPVFIASCAVAEVTIVCLLVLLRHLVPLGVLGVPRPSRAWLAVNYGFGAVGLVVVGFMLLGPTASSIDAFDIYLTVLTTLILWDLVRFVRAGRRPILMADLPFRGYVALAIFLFIGVILLGVTESPTLGIQTVAWMVTHILVGLAAAVPFALRNLGEVLRTFLIDGARFAVCLGILATARGLASNPSGPSGGQLGPFGGLDGVAAVLLLLALTWGSTWLEIRVDRGVLRQEQDWRGQLRGAVQDLAPEGSVEAVAQSAATAVTDILRVDAAGLILEPSTPAAGPPSAEGQPRETDDAEVRWPLAVTAGDFNLRPILEAWPELRPSMPTGASDLLWLEDEALQTALFDAGANWMVPVESPRRHWGYLFVTAGLLGGGASRTRLESLETFGRGLALVLEASDLMQRARRAERELARTEKLAALGETAARLAHEVRNPLTAARSLAQLMARDPMSAHNEEHGALVVRELDRVEERVQAMLQFARQECLRVSPVDLGELVHQTLRDLANYFASHGARASFEPPPAPVTVAGDRERLRQILVNLITNGVEAQRHSPQLELEIRRAHDRVTVRIRDRGPGVPEAVRGRLFEPFVSSKAKGTGLGLAISQRIATAHGGSLEASPADVGDGMVFSLHLPPLEAGGEARVEAQPGVHIEAGGALGTLGA
ncbi:MAG: ATP-binding protein [Acidobacteriota bacterium]